MMKMIGMMGAGLLLVVGCASDELEFPAAPEVRKVQIDKVSKPRPGAEAPGPQPIDVPKMRNESMPVEPPVQTKPRKGSVTRVDLQRVFELQGAGQILLVDVRPTFYYNLGHIPGAIGMQKRTFESAFAERKGEFEAAVAAGKVIVFYCADNDCPDAQNAARILARQGYSSSVYKGGWEEWKASGL